VKRTDVPAREEYDYKLGYSVMPKMGLVLQGGGALGAYEYGAVTRLVELGWHPVAVTGVSIGAATAAAVAGARGGNICKSLKRLWEAITLEPVPFWPPERQATFSIFGNPRFWRMRHDVFGYRDWTSLCDVSPMRETLATPSPMKVSSFFPAIDDFTAARTQLLCHGGIRDEDAHF
jgi:predicted acylesterase/phospholipase RssA